MLDLYIFFMRYEIPINVINIKYVLWGVFFKIQNENILTSLYKNLHLKNYILV